MYRYEFEGRAIVSCIPPDSPQHGVVRFRDPFGKIWFKMSRSACDHISRLGLTGTDYNVLMQLMSSVNERNEAYIRQKDIARHLNTYQSNVSKSIKRLTDLQVIRKSEDKCYKINGFIMWRGKDREACAQERKSWQPITDQIQ